MRTKAWIRWLGVTALLFGCGGGGGGGGGTASLVYSGAATRATVDASSAPDLAEVTRDGPGLGQEIQGLGDMGGAGRVAAGRQVADVAFRQVEAARQAGLSSSSTGTCGGSLTAKLDWVGPDFLDIDATVVFSDYCEEGRTTDGKVVLVSRLGTDGMVTVSESFTGVTVTDATQDLLLGGSLAATALPAGDTAEIVLDFAVEDRLAGVQAWFDHMTMSVVDQGAEQTVDLGGRVYHSEHGYVDITTDPSSAVAEPYTFGTVQIGSVHQVTSRDHPYDGGVLIVGAGGTAAVLEILDETSYRVVVDGGDLVFGSDDDSLEGPYTQQ